MTLVVNLFGGPGTGKSTTAAGAFAELKLDGVNAELVTEYAKDVVWGRTTATLDNQLYIFAKQHHRIFRLLGQVDVVVTDCPLFLSMHYGANKSNAFKHLVIEEFKALDNLNIFLNRKKAFNPRGRTQNEAQALEIDIDLRRLLGAYAIPYHTIDAERGAENLVAALVHSRLSGHPLLGQKNVQ